MKNSCLQVVMVKRLNGTKRELMSMTIRSNLLVHVIDPNFLRLRFWHYRIIEKLLQIKLADYFHMHAFVA